MDHGDDFNQRDDLNASLIFTVFSLAGNTVRCILQFKCHSISGNGMPQSQRYVAISIYESSSPAPDYKPLFEECLTIIEAESEEQARQKTQTAALEAQHSYQNQYGATITVTLKQIVDVALVLEQPMGDGANLYARFFRNYQAYCDFEPLLSGEAL